MDDGGRRHVQQPEPRNWFLLLALVLCVEFWLIAASAFMHSL
jgi:hypothetical protein